jgi:hypothetical protein
MRRSVHLAALLGCLVAACGGTSVTPGDGGTSGGGSSSGGSSGGTGGGCPTALCGFVCCPTGDSCVAGVCCTASAHCGSACCNSTQTCVGGECCTPADVCGPTCCPKPGTCLPGGVCCPTAVRLCSGTCCPSGSICIRDQTGTHQCATACSDSSECLSGDCCQLLVNGGGACISAVGATACLCRASTQCSSGCCAPYVDPSGDPIGPFVCKANDSAEYDCCTSDSCSPGNCCFADDAGHQFCSKPCTGSSECGVAHCNPYAQLGSCAGNKGCGP